VDTSSEYIKMCEKASEIQNMWEPSTPDFVVLRGSREVDCIGARKFSEVRVPDDVWIPRQDQLQEMVVTDSGGLPYWSLLSRFYDWALESGAGGGTKVSYKRASMEQLWLAFVMNEKYHKEWDFEKKEWVN